MELEHFLAFAPLIVMFLVSLKFRLFGLLHMANIAYCGIFAFIAIINGWGIIFLPFCILIAITSLWLFVHSMFEGSWF